MAANPPRPEPDRTRLRVTLVYEYECGDPTNREAWDDAAGHPVAMARLDIETDPTIILSGDWEITAAELKPGPAAS